MESRFQNPSHQSASAFCRPVWPTRELTQISSLNWQTVMDPLIDSSAMPIRSSITLFICVANLFTAHSSLH